MAMGTRKQRERQEDFWVAHTEIASAPSHPFYRRRGTGISAGGLGANYVDRHGFQAIRIANDPDATNAARGSSHVGDGLHPSRAAMPRSMSFATSIPSSDNVDIEGNSDQYRRSTFCSESQARNFSDSHDEHDVVGIKDHYLFGRLACPKEIPK
jgi:hypothetical protein